MLMHTMMLAAVLAIPAEAPPNHQDVRPALVTIHQVHEQPLDIALAWYAPTDGSSALSPPLEVLTTALIGSSKQHSGTVGMGDLVVRGTISNGCDQDVHMLLTDGSILTLAAEENLWIGSERELTPTHRCWCVCTCVSGNKSSTFQVGCDNSNGCSMEDQLCEVHSDPFLKPSGRVTSCRRMWILLPPVVMEQASPA